MSALLTNNAVAVLNAGISDSATSVTLNSGQGALFPNPGVGEYFYATLVDASYNVEIVKCTARTTDTLTIVRGQDGTTARAYIAGDRLELRPIAEHFREKADKGANTDITSLTGITGAISSADSVQFDTTAGVTPGVGQVAWDSSQGTLAVGLLGGNVISLVGQSLIAYVTNAEATTITKGQAVYLYQAVGDRASVKLAYNTGDATSAKTLGLVAEDIAAGQAGFVVCQGVCYKLNTSAYSPGDSLYLGSTAGSLTTTKPYAPNHLVYIGTVEKANAGNGEVYVRVQNGFELDELHNVSAQNPSNGQTIIWNNTTQLWEKGNLTAGTGIGITNGAGSITVSNGGVVTFSGGTTGLTPSSATSGAVTLGGTLAVANGGTGATSASTAISNLGGVPLTGNATITGGANTLLVGGYTNTFSATPNQNAFTAHPMGAEIWHDLFALTKSYTTTYETYNGSTWSSATLNKELFAQKENQSITVATGTPITAVRWTFTDVSWGSAKWLVIGHAWSNGTSDKTVLVETGNGTTWTTRHQSTYTTNASSIFHHLDSYSGDSHMRITITRNPSSTADIILSNIKLLTARPGDQGKGKELHYPYAWDGDQNITTGGNLTVPSGKVLELGHASDTTLARSAAGVVTIEGVEVVTLSRTQTLTNKTLTAPVISSITNTGTLTLPTSTDTLVGRATTDTLTNKTINLGSNTLVATSAQLAAAVTDETGTGSLVFSASPTFTGTANFADISASGSLTVTGDLTINGTTTTINSTTISVDDKNIELGSVATPSDTTADGGGIILKGATDKTFNWVNANSAWTSSEHIRLAAGKDLILAGATSGTVALEATATAGTTTIVFPGTSGTVITSGDTSTVTNTMLAGSIANNKLTNSSITINGTSTSLGGTISVGTVTSVAVSVPTGFSISGSPITSSGTIGITFSAGYSLPTTSSQSNWDTAFGWGNHASAGYALNSNIGVTIQGYDADLAAIAALAGTSGFLKKTAANTWSLDTNTYLTSYTETDPIYVASSWYTTTNNSSNWNTAFSWGNHASAGYLTSATAATTYQPLDADLTAIAGLTPTADNFIVGNGTAWIQETPAQARTSLGLGTIATLAAPSGTVVGTSDTQTLTNKRITSRVATTGSPLASNATTYALDTDAYDMFVITGQTATITSITTTGTPTNGQKLWLAITGTAAVGFTLNTSSFEASTIAFPTTTVTTARLDMGFVWNATSSRWRLVARA